MEDDNVFISPDEPYFHTYRIDYLNMARDTSHVVQVGTQIAGTGNDAEGGGGSNNSTTTIGSAMSNHFWANLVENVTAILDADGATGGNTVIPHPESGVLTVKATEAQHELLRKLIGETLANANRQVLIQANIVEVSLTDQFQAGIDWQALNQAGLSGFNLATRTITAGPVNAASLFSLTYEDSDPGRDRALSVAVELLQEFGDVRVLSSPRIMALNNQSAILKVVDNVVFFEVEQESNVTQGVAANTFETVVKTVPVGIVMTITPHIKADDSIILNIRPSISRINRFVNDPNPALSITSQVPEIRVREMESMLQLQNGEIAVMGGLMQDDNRSRDNAVPGLSRIPLLGNAFKMALREYEKTELVIFLRPLIVRNPSLDGDFSSYRQFFPGKGGVAPVELQQDRQGEAAIREMLARQPDEPYLHAALGRLQAAQARWPEAHRAFSTAHRIDPANPVYAINLAISLDRMGRWEEALEYYRTTLKLVEQSGSSLDIRPVVRRILALRQP